MKITRHGRRAVASLGFLKDVTEIYADEGRNVAVVYIALVLCANENGVVGYDERELEEFCGENAAEINHMLWTFGLDLDLVPGRNHDQR